MRAARVTRPRAGSPREGARGARAWAATHSSVIDMHSLPRHIITVDTISSGAQHEREMIPAMAPAYTSLMPPMMGPDMVPRTTVRYHITADSATSDGTIGGTPKKDFDALVGVSSAAATKSACFSRLLSAGSCSSWELSVVVVPRRVAIAGLPATKFAWGETATRAAIWAAMSAGCITCKIGCGGCEREARQRCGSRMMHAQHDSGEGSSRRTVRSRMARARHGRRLNARPAFACLGDPHLGSGAPIPSGRRAARNLRQQGLRLWRGGPLPPLPSPPHGKKSSQLMVFSLLPPPTCRRAHRCETTTAGRAPPSGQVTINLRREDWRERKEELNNHARSHGLARKGGFFEMR